jgi:hypothetical protein
MTCKKCHLKDAGVFVARGEVGLQAVGVQVNLGLVVVLEKVERKRFSNL